MYGFIEKDIINLTYIFEPLENMNKVDYRKITKEIQLEEKTKIFDEYILSLGLQKVNTENSIESHKAAQLHSYNSQVAKILQM